MMMSSERRTFTARGSCVVLLHGHLAGGLTQRRKSATPPRGGPSTRSKAEPFGAPFLRLTGHRTYYKRKSVCLSAPPGIMACRQLSFAHRLRALLLRDQLMLHVLRHDLRPLRCASHRSTPLVRLTTIDAGVTRWRRSIARDALFFSSFFFWWPSGGCGAQASRRRVAGMS